MKNIWCMILFQQPACVQEFFSRAYDLFFLDKFPLQEFLWGIVTPTCGYFQWPVPEIAGAPAPPLRSYLSFLHTPKEFI